MSASKPVNESPKYIWDVTSCTSSIYAIYMKLFIMAWSSSNTTSLRFPCFWICTDLFVSQQHVAPSCVDFHFLRRCNLTLLGTAGPSRCLLQISHDIENTLSPIFHLCPNSSMRDSNVLVQQDLSQMYFYVFIQIRFASKTIKISEVFWIVFLGISNIIHK